MLDRGTHRKCSEPADHDRHFGPPAIPGTSGFVPVRIIADALSHILALALHRDAGGNPRAGLSSRILASALRNGLVMCDPLVVRWMPKAANAATILREAWGTTTRHEGEQHCHLRAAAVGLLAAWAPGVRIEAERPRSGRGRHIRPDLQVCATGYSVIVAEVGTVEGDTIAALLLPGPNCRSATQTPPVTHVVVLPFMGQSAASARGYTFRLAGMPVLAPPSRTEVRMAWKTFAVRTAPSPSTRLATPSRRSAVRTRTPPTNAGRSPG